MRTSVFGVNFRNAPLEAREQVCLSQEQAEQLLRALIADGIADEAMVLSTCGRTEFYCVSSRRTASRQRILDHVSRIRSAPKVTDTSAFYSAEGADAVRHLFRVTAALDSQIIGEHEVTSQVKQAYATACRAGSAGLVMHKLLHSAFRTAKRVRTQTRLGEGTASIAQAAVDLSRRVFESLAGRTVLLVGAGHTAQLAAEALVRSGADSVIVANRTPERARELVCRMAGHAGSNGNGNAVICPVMAALNPRCMVQVVHSHRLQRRLAVQAIDLCDVPHVIGCADLLISSTGASECVITRGSVEKAIRRSGRTLLVIDIAVPRDVEASLGELDNVRLHNIDDIGRLIEQNLQRRRDELPTAEAIVEQERDSFAQWLASRCVPGEQAPLAHDEAQRAAKPHDAAAGFAEYA